MESLNTIHNSLRRAREFISEQNGTIAPLPWSEEELNPELDDNLSVAAFPIERTDSCYAVDYPFPKRSEKSEFRFFEDGRQRTIQIGCVYGEAEGNRFIIPVHYFVVAAVILKRERKQLRLWGEPVIRKGIFLRKSLLPDRGLLDKYENSGLEVIDTPNASADYYELRKAALQKAKDLRLAVEETLISRWRSLEADDTFLLVDGPLMNLRDEASVRRCVGVSKSFASRYFDVGTHNRIMEMAEFQRSWTFRFHDPNTNQDDQRLGSRERVSWYLRLRTHRNADPEFGLIRVEISKDFAGESHIFAGRFSQSLISERLPTSYPESNWHNHLFPICACQRYLSSILPSISTIKACMKG